MYLSISASLKQRNEISFLIALDTVAAIYEAFMGGGLCYPLGVGCSAGSQKGRFACTCNILTSSWKTNISFSMIRWRITIHVGWVWGSRLERIHIVNKQMFKILGE